jgi:hypothetical protein
VTAGSIDCKSGAQNEVTTCSGKKKSSIHACGSVAAE